MKHITYTLFLILPFLVFSKDWVDPMPILAHTPNFETDSYWDYNFTLTNNYTFNFDKSCDSEFNKKYDYYVNQCAFSSKAQVTRFMRGIKKQARRDGIDLKIVEYKNLLFKNAKKCLYVYPAPKHTIKEYVSVFKPVPYVESKYAHLFKSMCHVQYTALNKLDEYKRHDQFVDAKIVPKDEFNPIMVEDVDESLINDPLYEHKINENYIISLYHKLRNLQKFASKNNGFYCPIVEMRNCSFCLTSHSRRDKMSYRESILSTKGCKTSICRAIELQGEKK